MFYQILVPIVRVIVALINGNTHFEGLDNLPKDESFIMVAPHRTWWEPILFALAVSPLPCAFMAKKELFKNPILSFILKHANAFPVDRKNPGPSVIKTPVRDLTARNLSLIMFPSGTRFSSDLKGGAVLIAKLSKKPLVPVVYQGPLTFGKFLLRQRSTVKFGKPISIDRKLKINDENIEAVNQKMQTAWQQIDYSIDPNFHYVPAKRKH
ncbi:1-acyl-sn-glycerol-3-phosphate acyltransferase [Bombilactobacillus bombi]|uniref:1-acyl-sn-glycerol-3-phosphate acyltransferase n=1 Tax=Bombilactobacillus bombi TaxID=1303590 RepID=A0A3R7CLQ4_9LACO|nr:1-acyl-sn-glycerol-3-phosphate acyltransferase [Bombilactobacillus bombi]RHW48300.1 1-acyl-sn-glycerol-3-phosphate acyltransferase [Bombilactobacillus bombi]RHW49666.1 1-acyl-sn-glycerol-3-phosphate acyltransferase [Bombilactobacillus bombi]